jgi:hypothetical protein
MAKLKFSLSFLFFCAVLLDLALALSEDEKFDDLESVVLVNLVSILLTQFHWLCVY